MKELFLYSNLRQQKGGVTLEQLLNFLIPIMARVVGYYICKWLDRKNKNS